MFRIGQSAHRCQQLGIDAVLTWDRRRGAGGVIPRCRQLLLKSSSAPSGSTPIGDVTAGNGEEPGNRIRRDFLQASTCREEGFGEDVLDFVRGDPPGDVAQQSLGVSLIDVPEVGCSS